MGSQWDADLDDSDDELPDRIDEAVRKGNTSTEEYSYMHVSDIDALLKTEIKEGFFPTEGQGGGGYRITGLVSVTVEDASRKSVKALTMVICRVPLSVGMVGMSNGEL